MTWRKATFSEAVRGMLSEFDKEPKAQALALVWRTPDEYNVLDSWLLSRILTFMDEKTLRVVLWMSREEASTMISMIRKVE